MKTIVPALLLCVFCLAAKAQTFTALKAGGSVSTLKFEYDDNTQARTAWYAGLMANFTAAEQFFVRGELVYSIRGYKMPNTTTGVKSKISYSYLSVPVLGGYMPFKNFSIMAGPEIGYMLSAKLKDDNDKYDILGYVNNRFSIDANFGVSYFVTPELGIETHVLVGLTSLYRVMYTDINGNTAGPVRDGFNRVMQFGIIYKMSGN